MSLCVSQRRLKYVCEHCVKHIQTVHNFVYNTTTDTRPKNGRTSLPKTKKKAEWSARRKAANRRKSMGPSASSGAWALCPIQLREQLHWACSQDSRSWVHQEWFVVVLIVMLKTVIFVLFAVKTLILSCFALCCVCSLYYEHDIKELHACRFEKNALYTDWPVCLLAFSHILENMRISQDVMQSITACIPVSKPL